MDQASRSGLLEDSRFKEISSLKKKQVPHQLHWFLEEDYFSDELLGLYTAEIENFKKVASEAFDIFQQATTKLLADRQLHTLGIPKFFEECIYYSWERKQHHPFFTGRFDINGGIDKTKASVIEFNADTFSTLPETIYWQPLQR
jgi:glutathionylspermidine synthase